MKNPRLHCEDKAIYTLIAGDATIHALPHTAGRQTSDPMVDAMQFH
jgi:hypothetical protein